MHILISSLTCFFPLASKVLKQNIDNCFLILGLHNYPRLILQPTHINIFVWRYLSIALQNTTHPLHTKIQCTQNFTKNRRQVSKKPYISTANLSTDPSLVGYIQWLYPHLFFTPAMCAPPPLPQDRLSKTTQAAHIWIYIKNQAGIGGVLKPRQFEAKNANDLHLCGGVSKVVL